MDKAIHIRMLYIHHQLLLNPRRPAPVTWRPSSMEAQSSTSLPATEATQKVSSHLKRSVFFYINEHTWDGLGALEASERTPDHPKRVKDFVVDKANIWYELITKKLAPEDIRSLVIELHEQLYPGRTLVLINLRESAVRLRFLYVIHEYEATVHTHLAGTARHTGTATVQPATQTASH
eukprot:6189214-Pleurochrysis_carterae.AAC.1